MSVSPTSIGQSLPSASRGPREGLGTVPARWRMGQAIVLGLIGLLAIYYFTVGWQSPAGESRRLDNRSLFDLLGFVVLGAMVWLTTPIVGTIAMTTFQEAVRRKWMTALLAFALVMLALSTFFTFMQQGEQEKFMRDFGVGFIVIITLLMAIFLGVALIPPEIDRRTIFTILSKPVDRVEFILGKYLGLCLTIAFNLLVMTVIFLLSYSLFKMRLEGANEGLATGLSRAMVADPAANHPGLMFDLGNLSRALMLQFGLLSIMAAVAMTLSLILSGIAAIVFCFIVYFAGQVSPYWEYLSRPRPGGAALSGLVQVLVTAAYSILPRLDRFDVRERLVNGLPVAFNYMWKAFGSGLLYVAVLLTIAYLVFSDREF